MDIETLRSYLLAKPGTEETYPFDAVTLAVKVVGRIFALLMPGDGPAWLNLKCLPEHAEILRELYPAVRPGYHMNKRHWNTVVLDGTLADADLEGMIDESYRLVVAGLPRSRRPG